jgi:hypothetical protein
MPFPAQKCVSGSPARNRANRPVPAKNQTYETSAKPPINRSGVPAERRKPLEIEECGFLPKAATLLLQRYPDMNTRPRDWTSFCNLICPFRPGISHWLTMGKHVHRFKIKKRPSGHNNKNKVKE